MKKILISTVVILVTLILLVTTSSATFETNIKSNVSTTRVGETVTLTISTNEKIVASNFNINYDSTAFKLDGSGTSNLSVAEKDGKIACIYADISGTGTNEFKIKFTAQKETTAANFKIENAKFRAEGQETSYTGTQISGIEQNVSVKVEKTTEIIADNEKQKEESETGNKTTIKNDNTIVSKTTLPNTGKTTGVIVVAIIALIAVVVVLGKKSKELSKIFSSISIFVIVFVSVASFNISVNAAEDDSNTYLCTVYMKGYIPDKYTASIMIGKAFPKNKNTITRAEYQVTGAYEEEIYDCNGNVKGSNDLIKTGDKIRYKGYEYIVILYGDANGDGIMCDTDDLMIIINNYLGKYSNMQEYNRLASNLDNRDTALDIDDLVLMIQMHLGQLEDKSLVKQLPKCNINPDAMEGDELANVAHFGDYVYYNNSYWRVFSCPNNEEYSMNDVVLMPSEPLLKGKLNPNNINDYFSDPEAFLNIYDADYATYIYSEFTFDDVLEKYRLDREKWPTYNENSDMWFYDYKNPMTFWLDDLDDNSSFAVLRWDMCYKYNNYKDEIDGFMTEIGVMPGVFLKEGIKVLTGDGTINNAYTIAPIKDKYTYSSQQ